MRIVVSNPRRLWGGAATNTVTLARGLSERGHDVRVFCDPRAPFLEALGPDVAVDPILKGVELSPRVVGRCLRVFRRHGTQVVLSNTSKDLRLTAVAARLAGVPVVLRWGLAHPLSDTLVNRAFFGALPTRVVAVSHAAATAFAASGPWARRLGPVAIPNAVDAAAMAGIPPADLGLPDGALAVGYLGRLATEKGIYHLLEAWAAVAAELPRAHLVVAGEGPEAARLRARYGQLPRVHWLGLRRDAAAVLKALDLLVLPSMREGMPNTLLEAMAAGAPVLAARTPGVTELVHHGVNGRLVPGGDAEALGREIVHLAADEEERARLAANAHRHVTEHYPAHVMLDGYEALLRGTVRGVAAT